MDANKEKSEKPVSEKPAEPSAAPTEKVTTSAAAPPSKKESSRRKGNADVSNKYNKLKKRNGISGIKK